MNNLEKPQFIKNQEIENLEKIAEELNNEGNTFEAGKTYCKIAEIYKKDNNLEKADDSYVEAQKSLIKTADNDEMLIEALELAAEINNLIGLPIIAKTLFCQAANVAEKRGMIKKSIRLYRAAGKKDDVKRLS